MAPEVLAHQRYSTKADVYSFGICMWECITRQLPYAGMTAVQAAMGVVNNGLRPEIPPHVSAPLASLIKACWAPVADQRPSFDQIVSTLQEMLTGDAAHGSARLGMHWAQPNTPKHHPFQLRPKPVASVAVGAPAVGAAATAAAPKPVMALAV